MSDIVDMDAIEGSKENIQPRASGRSARALVASLTPTSAPVTPQGARGIQSVARKAFEKELETAAELDDPLEVWVRYFQWTLDTFPTGNTTESGMVHLLERATMGFLREPQYKNDPRYLKMWIHYIQHYSDAPREHFAYLVRHDIGQRLALFYEEFATFLESIGRKNQAAEVYQRGIENNARPVERLIRKYAEFRERLAANPADPDEPSSPAYPSVRPALGAKPFGGAAVTTPDPQASRGLPSSAPAKQKKKLAVFSDADADAEPTPSRSSKWDSIGTYSERKKENTMEAKPWAGETLKQDTQMKKRAPKEKLQVFRDTSSNPNHTFHGFPMPERPSEKVAVDLESVYPNWSGSSSAGSRPEEYSFEELRAKSRGLYGLDWNRIRADEAEQARLLRQRERQIREQQQQQRQRTQSPGFKDSLTPVKIKMVMSPSPNKPKIKKMKKNGRPASPTMTFHTRAATDEIYDMFNQPLEQALPDDEDETSTEESDGEGDYITVDLAKALGPQNATADDDEEDEEESESEDEEEGMTEELDGEGEEDDEEEGEEDEEDEEEESEESGEDEEEDEEDEESDFSEAALDELTQNTNSNRGGRLSDGPTITPQKPRQKIEPLRTPEDYNPPLHRWGDPAEIEKRKLPFMTPITEVTERLPPTTQRRTQPAKTPRRYDESTDEDEEWEEPLPPTSNRRGSGRVSLDGNRRASLEGKGNKGKLIVHRDENDENAPPPRLARKKVEIPPPPEDFDPPKHPFRDPVEAENRKLPFMTPITEVTERIASTVHRDKLIVMRTPTKYASGSDVDSSAEDEEAEFVTPTSTPLPQLKDFIKERKAKALQPKDPLMSTPLGATRGPIIDDAQCNPCDGNLRNQILENIRPPLASFDGFNFYTSKFGKSDTIRRYCKAAKKDGSSSGGSTTLTFPGGKAPYTFKKELGKGAFAPVYLVENQIFGDGDDDDTGNEFGIAAGLRALGRRRFEAVKMEQPPSAWEYYIIRTAKRRLGYSRASASIVTAHEFHLFPDECYLVLDYFSQGTIIDLVNLAKNDSTISTSGQIDEQLVMFLTIELLRTIEALHSKSIIHGDLKPDNVLVRFEPIPENAWSSRYFADGSGGWDKKGLALIDFGRGIDMTAYKPSVQFIADWPPDAQDCAEIREMRPWTYQIDYHGVAGIIHTMLFGKFIETVTEKVEDGLARKRYRVASAFKRYWQQDIWADCFDVLLNSGSYVKKGGALPVEREIREVRKRMEGWLEGNAERGAGLKTVIRRMEGVLSKRR